MAKYLASPRYAVGDIQFSAVGEYVTDDYTEIKRLDALVPTWVKRVDEPEKVKSEEPNVEAEKGGASPQKPTPKQRKPAAAKTSEK